MQILILSVIFGLFMSSSARGSGLTQWNLSAVDVLERPVTLALIEGRVTALSFGSRSTRKQSEELGQFLGDRFGGRFGFQSVALINTSAMPFFVRPLVNGIISRAYDDAIEEAVQDQQRRGHLSATAERERSRMYFINDKDGSTWRYFGAEPESDDFYFGVLDAAGRLIYLTKNPSQYEDIALIFERELVKLETKVSRK